MEHITSRKNPKIQHIKKLGSSKAYRTECGEFLCDGRKLLEEAVSNGAEVLTVAYCGDAPDVIPEDAAVIEVTRDIIEYISPMKTPQDVLFICKMPERKDAFVNGGKYIVIEEIKSTVYITVYCRW